MIKFKGNKGQFYALVNRLEVMFGPMTKLLDIAALLAECPHLKTALERETGCQITLLLPPAAEVGYGG